MVLPLARSDDPDVAPLDGSGTKGCTLMSTPDFRCWLPASGLARFSASGLAMRWPLNAQTLQAMLGDVSRTTWSALAAAVAGCALLLGFQQVVSQSVLQIEQRRVLSAAQDEQLWRCKQLPKHSERVQCRADLQVGL